MMFLNECVFAHISAILIWFPIARTCCLSCFLTNVCLHTYLQSCFDFRKNYKNMLFLNQCVFAHNGDLRTLELVHHNTQECWRPVVDDMEANCNKWLPPRGVSYFNSLELWRAVANEMGFNGKSTLDRQGNNVLSRTEILSIIDIRCLPQQTM